MTIFETIEYILPGTSFIETQCRIIERALYRHLMGKLGLTTKFPLAYKFGPHKFQGAALLEIYVAQMIGKLMVFLYHANIESQLHSTFILSIEALQLEIGSKQQFSQQSIMITEVLPHLHGSAAFGKALQNTVYVFENQIQI